jgi:hypothetical protein
MNDRKLTEEQIDDLFLFCEYHNVKYYDLQVEMIDHLASAIEEKWKENPALLFQDVLNSGYKEFGIYGFSKIKQMKEKELKRKYFNLRNRYIREFFRLPKILLTVAIAVALSILFRLSNDKVLAYLIFFGIYLIGLSVYLFIIYPKQFKIKLIDEKKLLLLDYFNSLKGNILHFGVLPLNIFTLSVICTTRFNINLPFADSSIYDFILALLMTLFGISMVAMATHIPVRIKNDILHLYPQIILP